jgi:hypothetical protein
MPVRIKINQCVPRSVVNGASGVIYHIDWPETTTFCLQPNGTWLASTQPNNIFIDMLNSPSTTPLDILPPTWPSSVMPVFEVTAKVDMKGDPLSVRGYPIVPAFGTTVHGAQGETRDTIAITNLRPSHVKRVDTHALYVALSRLQTRHGLHWIGERPTDFDYEIFGPANEVLLEDLRLKRLSTATIANFKTLEDPTYTHTI